MVKIRKGERDKKEKKDRNELWSSFEAAGLKMGKKIKEKRGRGAYNGVEERKKSICGWEKVEKAESFEKSFKAVEKCWKSKEMIINISIPNYQNLSE